MSYKENIVPLNEYGQYHGLCIWYYDNGNVRYKRRFVNGKRHGMGEDYWGDGKLDYKCYYNNYGRFVYAEWYEYTNKIRFYI